MVIGKRRHRGFTLIELLVVISIIGLISTVAFVGINNARAKARDGQRKANLGQLKKALELYYNTNSQTYPTTANPPEFVCVGSGTPGGITPFINPVPVDPVPEKNSISTNCMQYTGDGTDYKLRLTLELDTQTSIDDGGTSSAWYELFTPGAQSW